MADEVLDAVGPRLRALRKQRGLTLADLATATGTSENTLSRLENGGRRPTLELLLPRHSSCSDHRANERT
jgi:DNA-binding XRE family transcriptional regulator